MRRTPVILAPADDPSAAWVHWGLGQWGVEPLWASSLVGEATGTVSIHDDSGGSQLGFGEDGPSGVGAVWYRRPRDPPYTRGVLESDRPFVRDEWALFQANVFSLASGLTGALWVNAPKAAIETENKLVQLQAARSVGLRVPETLMSNDARAVRAFIARHGRVIYKTFMPHSWRNRETGRLYNATATLLDATSSFEDASVTLCPGIYQRYVEKRCDLRVTLIGERCFALSLRSQRGGAFVDWRPHARLPEMVAEVCELPETCRLQLRALMDRLGIVFGCVDLAADAEGNLYFLEVNQAGQFLFVEELAPSLPVLQAMCALLAQGRVDYSLEPSREVSLERCQSSDAYQSWMARHGDSMKVENWLCTSE